MRLEWSDLKDRMKLCSACGRCESACPTFKAADREFLGPRGRVALGIALFERRIQPNEAIKSFSACLQCGKCEAACPAGLPLSSFFFAIRVFLRKYFYLSPWQKLLEGMLLSQPAAVQFLHPPAAYGLALKNRLAKNAARLSPYPAMPFALRGSREPAEKMAPALLFTGCIARHIFPGLAEDCVAALRESGHEVISPTALGCCGRPWIMRGASPLAGVKRNLEILKKSRFEKLLTPCPGCLRTICEIWPNLPGLSASEKRQASDLASRSEDICSYLTSHGKLASKGAPKPIFWHKPCLLEDEKAALELAGGAIVGKSGASSCCGGPLAVTGVLKKHGADFQDGNSSFAGRLASGLRHQALASGATIMLTACPGCMLALMRENRAAREEMPVLHILSFSMRGLDRKDNYQGVFK